MVKNIAWAFASLFLFIGVLGFVPGVTSNGNLFGVFAVDSLHSIIHLITGIVFALVAWNYMEHSSLSFKVFGVFYALVAIIGFVQGDTVLGLFVTNMSDNVLYLFVAVAAIYAGFFLKEGGGDMPMPQHNMGGGMPDNPGGGENHQGM